MTFYSAVFDTAVFDSSYFDITDDEVLTWRTNGDALIDKTGENVTLTKESKTLDSEGKVTSVSTTSDTIKVKIQPITEDERQLYGRGEVVTGIFKLFTKNHYDLTNNGDDSKVEVGDIITRNSIDFRVEQANNQGNEVHKEFIIRRIGV